MKKTVTRVLSIIMSLSLLLALTGCEFFAEQAAREEAEKIYALEEGKPSYEYAVKKLAELRTMKAAGRYKNKYKMSDAQSENVYLRKSISTLQKFALGNEKKHEWEYGEDTINSLYPIFELNFKDVKSATCELNDDGNRYKITLVLASTETADAEDPDKITYHSDAQLIDGIFPNNESEYSREMIEQEFKKSVDYITLDGWTADYGECTIYIEADAETDELLKVVFIKNYNVTATVTGVKTLADMGTVELKVKLTREDEYYDLDFDDPDLI